MGGPPVSFKESGHLAHIFIVAGASCSRPSMERPAPCFAKPITPPLLHLLSFPGRAMQLCSADLSPQALMRARCPRSLVMNRRREAASPYHSKLGAGRSKDGLGQDVPATMKRCPARCRTQPAGRWRSPFEEAAYSSYSFKI